MKPRFFWVDLMRVLAIYFVVVIHNSVLPNTITISNIASFIIFTVIKTCVPIFIMLSGALLLGKKEPYNVFFYKRFLKVIFPWIIWTFLYMLWNYFFHHYPAQNLSQWKYLFELTLLSQLWFLPLIAGIYLLTPILRIFVSSGKKQDMQYFLLIYFLLSSILPYIHPSVAFPFDQAGFLTQAILYSGYFVLGYGLVNKMFLQINNKIVITIFFISILWTIFSYVHTQSIVIAYNYLAPNIALCSVTVFILLFRYFQKYKTTANHIKSLITKISTASLGIYIIHQPLMDIFYPIFLPIRTVLLQIDSVLVGIVVGFIYFLLSFVIVYALQKIPLVRNSLP